MSLYCAIDLHSTNNVPAIIDDDDRILFQKRLPNDLSTVISALKPFKHDLYGVAVESTLTGIGSLMAWPTMVSIPYWLTHPLLNSMKALNTPTMNPMLFILHI